MRIWGIVKQKASTPRSYMVDTPVGTVRDTVQYPADPSTPTFSGEELVENEKNPVVDYPSNDSEDGQIRTRNSNSTARQSSFKLATVSVNCDVEEGAIFLNDLEAKSFKCRGRRLDSSLAMRFGQDPRSLLMILAAHAWILSILDRLVLLALIQAGVAYSKIGLTSARYVRLFCIGEVVFGDPDGYVICVKGNFSWQFDKNSVEGLGKVDEGCYSGFCRFMMEAVLDLLNEVLIKGVFPVKDNFGMRRCTLTPRYLRGVLHELKIQFR
ncbi:hypothetical protein LAZ67_7003515 [Cordylochernes scorpioides]|uniref:Uncharacterized protein n=1 Tax=Cordylochernes scorpioides TaxID=51811 RepID=A0ABY6KPH0_9ARAC|nr:hypothetical protein LAZ67_7003515 [Cordylochernes scorpioides]